MNAVKIADAISGLQIDYLDELKKLEKKQPRFEGTGFDSLDSLLTQSIFGYSSDSFYLPDFLAREKLVRKYAWAIPNHDALKKIYNLQMPICEIGAGKGYWGYLLRQLGVECFLYDNESYLNRTEISRYCYFDNDPNWTEVEEGGTEKAAKHKYAALFLCWPPYAEPMAYEALLHYQGKCVIFVGEGNGGCTGDERFFQLVNERFELVDSVKIPQYYGIHDRMFIYEQ